MELHPRINLSCIIIVRNQHSAKKSVQTLQAALKKTPFKATKKENKPDKETEIKKDNSFPGQHLNTDHS
eukprot:11235851-Ditylum_brightwellii.AAC.1